GSRVDSFRGSHNGYQRLDQPVTHVRECLLDRQAPRVLVRDTLTGRGEHEFAWRFPLDPALRPELNGSDVRLVAGSQDVWVLPDERAAGMTFDIEDGWVSPSYGVRVPTRVLVWRVRAGIPFTVSYLFAESCLTADERARTIAILSQSLQSS